MRCGMGIGMRNKIMAIGLVAGLMMSATPAAALDGRMQWLLRINEGRVSDATLAYAAPESDYQLISLTCEEGGARIFASMDVANARLRVLGLKSGEQALVVGGKTIYHDEVDIYNFTSQAIDANSPLFDAFAATGSLTELSYGTETEMKGDAKAKGVIARFVRFCRGA